MVVAKSWKISPKYKTIVGGGYSNQFISIQNKSKEEIHKWLDQLKNKPEKMNNSTGSSFR